MKNPKLILPGLAATLFFAFQSALALPVVYIDDSAGLLGKVDVQTGATTIIGATGVALTDIAFDASGNLFGVSFTDFYKINPLTAATTLVGSLGVNDANSLVFGSDGTLYSAGVASSA